MIIKRSSFDDYNSFTLECCCEGLGHVASFTYFLYKDKFGKLFIDDVEIAITEPFIRQWYRRLFYAFRYVFRPSNTLVYQSILVCKKDIPEVISFLQNALNGIPSNTKENNNMDIAKWEDEGGKVS